MITANINESNFLSDLEILAIRINEYLSLRERLDADDPKLTHCLNDAIRYLENTAVIYTDLLENHESDRQFLEWQLKHDALITA